MNLENQLVNEFEKHEKLKEKERKRHKEEIQNIIDHSDMNVFEEKKNNLFNLKKDISNRTREFRDNFYTILNKFLKGDDKREVINNSVTVRDNDIYRYRSNRQISFNYFYVYLDVFEEENPDGLVSKVREELECLCEISRKEKTGKSLSKFLYEGNNHYIVIKSSPNGGKFYIKETSANKKYKNKEDIIKSTDLINMNFEESYVEVKPNLRRYLSAEEDILKALEEYKQEILRIQKIQEEKIEEIREKCKKEMAYVTLNKI